MIGNIFLDLAPDYILFAVPTNKSDGTQTQPSAYTLTVYEETGADSTVDTGQITGSPFTPAQIYSKTGASGKLIAKSVFTAGRQYQFVWELTVNGIVSIYIEQYYFLNSSSFKADVSTLESRLSATRAGYLDKLNVSGTLAHTDNAASFKATGFAVAGDAMTLTAAYDRAKNALAYTEYTAAPTVSAIRTEMDSNSTKLAFIPQIMNASGTAGFVQSTDSLEAIRNRVDDVFTATGTPIGYSPSSATRVAGSDQGGVYTDLVSHDAVYFATGEDASTGLEVIITRSTSTTTENPSLVRVSGYYTGTNHYIGVYLWDYVLSAWHQVGTMTNRSDPFDYVFPMTADNHNPATGEMKIRFLHNVTTYNATHRLYLDFVSWEKVQTNSQITSDIAAVLAQVQQLQFSSNKVLARNENGAILTTPGDAMALTSAYDRAKTALAYTEYTAAPTVSAIVSGIDSDSAMLAAIDDSLTAITNSVNGISNVVRLSVAMPPYLEIPAAGTNAIKIEIALKDNNGNMENPDSNKLYVYVNDSAGNSQSANLFQDYALTTPLTGTNETVYTGTTGLFYFYFRTQSTDTDTSLSFQFFWEESAAPLYEYRSSQRTGSPTDIATLLGRLSADRATRLDTVLTQTDTATIVDSVWDATTRSLTDKTGYSLGSQITTITDAISTAQVSITGTAGDTLQSLSDQIDNISSGGTIDTAGLVSAIWAGAPTTGATLDALEAAKIEILNELTSGNSEILASLGSFTVDVSTDSIVEGVHIALDTWTPATQGYVPPIILPPANGSDCRVYLWIAGQSAAVIPEIVEKATAKIINLPFIASGRFFYGQEISGTYDSGTGILYWDIIRGSQVLLYVPIIGIRTEITVPDADTLDLSTL